MLIISIKQIILNNNFKFDKKSLIHFKKFNKKIILYQFFKIKLN